MYCAHRVFPWFLTGRTLCLTQRRVFVGCFRSQCGHALLPKRHRRVLVLDHWHHLHPQRSLQHRPRALVRFGREARRGPGATGAGSGHVVAPTCIHACTTTAHSNTQGFRRRRRHRYSNCGGTDGPRRGTEAGACYQGGEDGAGRRSHSAAGPRRRQGRAGRFFCHIIWTQACIGMRNAAIQIVNCHSSPGQCRHRSVRESMHRLARTQTSRWPCLLSGDASRKLISC